MPINYKNYPANWKEIRQKILERDGHCCKICKVPNRWRVFRGIWNGIEVYQDSMGRIFKTENGEFLADDMFAIIEPSSGNENQKAIKIVLTVAHLNHDINDNFEHNLAALCQLHHLRLDVDQHKENSRATIEKKKRLQRLF